jgi:multidrug efflux pump subunit AcrB
MGTEFMAVVPTGVFESEKDFGELLISSKGGRLVYLRDVATVTRGYQEPPQKILRVNGQPALGIAISTRLGGNAVVMGDAVDKRIRELIPQIPLGINLEVISLQSATVTKAINGFVINLLEAVAIVVVILLIFMGLKSGLIIGFILLLTIAATFVMMGYYQITLERISLGALIIALGMLVDNAIVVVDGMKVRIEKGMDGIQAAKEVVSQNAVPLFGATAVAVLAFASIGGMDNQTGEYCRSLYYVILISLSLSWLTAITTTPLMTYQLMKPKKGGDKGAAKDPYAGKFYQYYKKGLESAIRFRWVTLGVVAGLFVAALIGFGQLDQMFFPSSTSPQFLIECQWRSGNHIRETEKGVARMEEYLLSKEGITQVASSIASGHPRFLLTYSAPSDVDTHYAVLLVTTDNYKKIDEIGRNALADLEESIAAARRQGNGGNPRRRQRPSHPERVGSRGQSDTAGAEGRRGEAVGNRPSPGGGSD